MTKKDESPEEGANPYWSDELLAVLAEALGDEDRARQTLGGIIQQASATSAPRLSPGARDANLCSQPPPPSLSITLPPPLPKRLSASVAFTIPFTVDSLVHFVH